MSYKRPSHTVRKMRSRFGAAMLVGGVLALSVAGVATAKVETVGGGGGAPAACNPVSALSYKGDATTSETGLSTIDVTYSVKPCDKNPVVVDVKMFESIDPSAVVYSDSNAPLSGKFRVAGVKADFSYQVRVSVSDATTGALVGSQTIFAAAKHKPV